VTVIVVLLWVQGILEIAAGLVLVFTRNNSTVIDQLDWTSGGIAGAGIGAIVFGVITILVAWGLGSGRDRGGRPVHPVRVSLERRVLRALVGAIGRPPRP